MFGPAATPTRNCCAAGVDVKNERSKSFLAVAASLSSCVGFSGLAAVTIERMDRNWEMTASLRAPSCFKDIFNFLVSCNFLRCSRIVSGVGVFGDGSKERFC